MSRGKPEVIIWVLHCPAATTNPSLLTPPGPIPAKIQFPSRKEFFSKMEEPDLTLRLFSAWTILFGQEYNKFVQFLKKQLPE